MSTDDELTRLVRTLHETQQRIVELTGGTVDAVVDPSGASYLLLQAQEQQRRAATQRTAILNALPAHIALLDPHGRIIAVNEAWRRFAVANVFPDDDFGVGRNYLDICEHAHGDCSEEALDAAAGIRAVLNGEQPQFALEYPCHSPTERRWFRLMVTPVEDRDNAGAVVTHIDISERNRLEERLRQSQRLEAVGQLTGGIAHDFNNLLTVILGNAELLNEELAEDARLRPLAEMIVSGAQRGAELTHRLLAFARKQALEPRVVDVNRLITGMDPMLHRTLGEHIEIELLCGSGLWPALIDPGQLESALLNLAINARDAMPRGGKLIIETANTELDEDYTRQQTDVRPGKYVRVTVSDTGCGIPPEHLERVFEPFYTTKGKGKGTGLGLSMVYGFIKQSDGHVRLYSEPGEGTTIRMYLPRITDQAEAAPPNDVEIPATGGNETILLVEDDAMVRSYAQGQLAGLGYRVLTAANGPEALVILRQHVDIDLLFTDIVMPGGMNGRELADAARAIRPDLKVLFTSGYTENAIVHHGRLDPGVQLLSKPYRRSDLARKIREALADPT